MPRLPGAARPRCRSCARPWRSSDRCATCREAPPAYDATVAAADYAAPLDRAITSLKFAGQIGLASGLGALLAQALQADDRNTLGHLDCIVPVPLASRAGIGVGESGSAGAGSRVGAAGSAVAGLVGGTGGVVGAASGSLGRAP